MPLHNKAIAERLARLADLLEVEGANPFRVRAYRNAARTIEGSARSIADMVAAGEDLSRLPDIGADLADQVRTLLETGSLPQLEEAEERTPPGLSTLMQLRGLGPRRVAQLHRELGVADLEDLKRAARAHRVQALEGFGAKTEAALLEQAQAFTGGEGRTRLRDAEGVARALVAHLEDQPGVGEVTVAGSYRRRRETVGDLDVLVTARAGAPVMDAFTGYADVAEVLSRGETRSRVRLAAGLAVDLRVVPRASRGAALHYFTGSKAHNIAVRRRGVERGLKVNEYGVFRGEERVAGETEEEVYASVGLAWVPPELREGRGEVEAAAAGRLPRLLTRADLRGDLHSHSHYSDGHDTLADMARAAADLGYAYLAVSDHSRRVTMAHGLDERRLRAQMAAIDELNETLEGVVLLKACEVDILEDGSLDLPDTVLGELDLTVCSIHYGFDLPRERQTARVLRAMDNPRCNILGHPTGRLIGEREPYAVDLEAVVSGARERGCILELNANPERLDLSDAACLMAREAGVLVAVSSDAHSAQGLEVIPYGVNQARRGWLEPGDVVNTRTLAGLREALERP